MSVGLRLATAAVVGVSILEDRALADQNAIPDSGSA